MYCNKNYQINLDENLNKLFFNTYKFSNHDINKFILLLRKGVHPYEYMDDSEKFSETLLPEKEDSYSHLNMENITVVDYAYAKKVCKGFKRRHLGDYHDIYIQSDTLSLADVFGNFWNICLEIKAYSVNRPPKFCK